jgi:hypothetical protein
MWKENIKQSGFDDTYHAFDDLIPLQKIVPIQSMFWVDKKYLVETDTSKGLLIRDRNYDLLYTQPPIDGRFPFFCGLYDDKVYLLNHDGKKSYQLDLTTKALSPIPYLTIIPGITFDHQQFCAFKNAYWLFDFETDQCVWKHEIQPFPPRHQFYSSNLFWKHQIVITDASYKHLSIIDLNSGMIIDTFYPLDNKELKHNTYFNLHYIIGDLVIGFGDIKRDPGKGQNYKDAGVRDLIGVDLKKRSWAWKTHIHQWIGKVVSPDGCFHYFYYHPTKQAVHYAQIDLLNGDIRYDYSIQAQLDHFFQLETQEEIIALLTASPRISSLFSANDCIYFVYGTHFLKLTPDTQNVEVFLKRNDLIPFAPPIYFEDKMIITDTLYQLQ